MVASAAEALETQAAPHSLGLLSALPSVPALSELPGQPWAGTPARQAAPPAPLCPACLPASTQGPAATLRTPTLSSDHRIFTW